MWALKPACGKLSFKDSYLLDILIGRQENIEHYADKSDDVDDGGEEDDGDNGAICIQSRLQRWPAGDHWPLETLITHLLPVLPVLPQSRPDHYTCTDWSTAWLGGSDHFTHLVESTPSDVFVATNFRSFLIRESRECTFMKWGRFALETTDYARGKISHTQYFTPAIIYPYYSPLENHCQEGWQASKPKDYALSRAKESNRSTSLSFSSCDHMAAPQDSSKQCALCVAECCKALTAPLIDSDKVATAKFEAEGQPLERTNFMQRCTLLSSATRHQERVEEQIWGGCSTLEKRCWKLITNSGGAPASA